MNDFEAWGAELDDQKCAECVVGGKGRKGVICHWHRCKAIRRNGERCKARVGANMEDYCHTHGCAKMISFAPCPMRCSEPVVIVETGRGWATHACLKHAEEDYPEGRITAPQFTYE